ncbi:3-methyladenine DNA glycosylase AlkD [Mucilaginibacter mallensis]|uniref:3-methyladenine DNA glycosylase AlkD n=1 Tax=Mucilaginibacter mallensis TaxID=652787 RepID=A0A1H1QT00_MUCMA|nr:DNA alkylation repair protein [Mucilaginibacter mallensis]SDS26009.1 3-methyladenine DNA glycosylase AlkD [Mucilaginibacter mallensis]
MTVDEILNQLKQKSNSTYHAGMLRFGVDNSKALGVPIPQLRKLAKSLKKNHQLALKLWDTGIHEARILASMIDDPALVAPVQMDSWTNDFYSWDLCDQVCGNLFDRTPFAIEKALFYTTHQEEYIKRAGFVLMAEYAVHNKTAADTVFIALLPVIEREAWDERNFVKKAVNWALRQIGKRNELLRAASIASAGRILLQNSKAAKWIATNALKELVNE